MPPTGVPSQASELEAASRHVAGELFAVRPRPGDRLLCSPGDPLPFAVMVVAALRSGLVVVPVNPELTAPELRHVIDETRPVASRVADVPAFRSLAETDRTFGSVSSSRPPHSPTPGAVDPRASAVPAPASPGRPVSAPAPWSPAGP